MEKEGVGGSEEILQMSSILVQSSAEHFALVVLGPRTAQCHQQGKPMAYIHIYIYICVRVARWLGGGIIMFALLLIENVSPVYMFL